MEKKIQPAERSVGLKIGGLDFAVAREKRQRIAPQQFAVPEKWWTRRELNPRP
jgi:hypothetical protein